MAASAAGQARVPGDQPDCERTVNSSHNRGSSRLHHFSRRSPNVCPRPWSLFTRIRRTVALRPCEDSLHCTHQQWRAYVTAEPDKSRPSWQGRENQTSTPSGTSVLGAPEHDPQWGGRTPLRGLCGSPSIGAPTPQPSALPGAWPSPRTIRHDGVHDGRIGVNMKESLCWEAPKACCPEHKETFIQTVLSVPPCTSIQARMSRKKSRFPTLPSQMSRLF